MAWSDEMDALADAVDGAFGVSVTYRSITPGTFTGATGARTPTTADTTVTAVRGRARTIETGRRPIEEVLWTIAADQVPSGSPVSGVPRIGDRIVDGTFTYEITAVEHVADREMYELTTHRTAA